MDGDSHDRLTALDESFLHMEGPGLPMHVASVATFEAGPLLADDGELRLADIRRHIESRAHLLPRLRQRVWNPPAGIDHARWTDDEQFDIARHIDVVEAPAPGDDAALRAVASRAESELLDREHPLWHLRFVTGLVGDRVGLIQRTHHAMVDGVSGVDVAAVMLDLGPDPGPDEVDDWHPGPAPDNFEAVVDLVRDRLKAPVGVVTAVERALQHPVESLRRGRVLVDGLGTLLQDGIRAPECSLNVPVGEGRELAWVRADLDELKGVAHASETTVNDVILTTIAGGVRSILLHRGEAISVGRTLKILVPVSLRETDEHGTLGNRVGAYLLPLPIGVGDPESRLRATSEAMRRLKGQHEAAGSDLVLGVANLLPSRVAAAIARSVNDQHTVNLVITNVPGPREPLYLLGAEMLEVFPVVPLGGNLPLGVAILSYRDAINIGITADPDACPDLGHFVDGVQRALAELTTT